MENKGHYLIGQDISGCKCGQGDYSVITYFVQTTRYIETDMTGDCGMAWVCEQCSCTWHFEYHPKEDAEMNFCPGCGRKIVEFVDYMEESEDEV